VNAAATKDDAATIGAISLVAMCLVTFDHEALGHGGTCLAAGGRILELTSAIFRCDLRSPWIAPAGPIANLVMGTLALALSRRFVVGGARWGALARPAFWIPVGALASAALAVGLWMRSTAPVEELPLEPLLAAHERYSAEALVPEAHLTASTYSDQMNALYDGADNELE